MLKSVLFQINTFFSKESGTEWLFWDPIRADLQCKSDHKQYHPEPIQNGISKHALGVSHPDSMRPSILTFHFHPLAQTEFPDQDHADHIEDQADGADNFWRVESHLIGFTFSGFRR